MFFKDVFLPTIIYAFVTIYSKTWRYKFHNKSNYLNEYNADKSPIMAVWHEHLLASSFSHRGEGVITIASDSKDGNLITGLLKKWKYNVVRGSSSNGGIKAAIAMIRLAKQKHKPLAITVDGPKGPRHIVKSGAVLIAKKLKQPIIIAVAKAKCAKRFNSWDKFLLPLPFAKIDMYYSKPIYLSADTDEISIKADTEFIQQKMLEFTNASSADLL